MNRPDRVDARRKPGTEPPPSVQDSCGYAWLAGVAVNVTHYCSQKREIAFEQHEPPVTGDV